MPRATDIITELTDDYIKDFIIDRNANDERNSQDCKDFVSDGDAIYAEDYRRMIADMATKPTSFAVNVLDLEINDKKKFKTLFRLLFKLVTKSNYKGWFSDPHHELIVRRAALGANSALTAKETLMQVRAHERRWLKRTRVRHLIFERLNQKYEAYLEAGGD
jgi:hypothetical protein